jgi:hypothetical protein
VRRLRERLSLTNVAATLALFLALGAGYAAAFSGSGKLQKATVRGLPSDGTTKLVRKVTGVAHIRASCADDDPDDASVRIKNTSGHEMNLFSDKMIGGSPQEADFEHDPAFEPGEKTDFLLVPAGPSNSGSLLRFYLSKTDGGKRRQADISITVKDTNDCATMQVSVLNLTTEQ